MLDVRDVTKAFTPGKPVLNAVSLRAPDGQVACLLGPSGCGKTTLLRVIAGLEPPDAGSVWLDGAEITTLPVHLRRFGFMFQDYALFPHLSVGANVAYGLRMAGWDAPQRQARVAEMLDLVNLPGYAARPVDALSGGEQQRVALARTLAGSPRLLLLDEPLANLDRLLREELVDELRGILRRVGVTTIFVTHDQAEAFALADRVLVMRAGRIVQDGAPQAVYSDPASAFVAGFLGFSNLLPGTYDPAAQAVVTALGTLPLAQPPDPAVLAAAYCVLVRPDAAHVGDGPGVRLVGRVQAATFRGSVYRTQLVVAKLVPGLELGSAAGPGLEPSVLSFDLPAQETARPTVGVELALTIDPGGVQLVADA